MLVRFFKITTLGILLSHTLLAQPILLPVEVIGPDQTEETRSFSLEDVTPAKELFLLINNFSYDNKASVRFNDGSWVSLNNANTRVYDREKAFGGIGGGYSTIRLTYPVAPGLLNPGENILHFRYNSLNDTISSGYRVVDFNLLDENGNRLIANDVFTEDDPATWQPPLPDAASISDGRALWDDAPINSSPLATAGPMRATCGDCHAQDGRDLKYFNYSNKSIVERAVFHGLSPEEGQKIASYIRSLDAPAPAQARPWNPPYQPGPGLDNLPAEEWAAGAGLEWALDTDEEMLPYFFPNGTRPQAIAQVVDIKGTLNTREMPVALQFPDWKHWLPRVHPKDMMSDSDWQQSQMVEYYTEVRQAFETQGTAALNDTNDELANITRKLSDAARDFLWEGHAPNEGHPWTVKESAGIRKNTSRLSTERYKLNLAHWSAVKHWEVMQEFKVAGVTPRGAPAPEARQWPARHWTLFNLAAHIIGDQRGTSHLVGQEPVVGYYFSTAWYQLQLTLNSGMRDGRDVEPVDWAYNYQHILKASRVTGQPEPLRYFQNLLKAYQQRDNDQGVQLGGWNMREVSPWRTYSSADGYDDDFRALNDYESGLRAKLTGAMVREFLRKSTTYERSDWPTCDGIRNAGAKYWTCLEPADYTPKASNGRCLFLPPGACSDDHDAVEADAIYILVPLLIDLGVDCSVTRELALWGESLWPKGDWEQYLTDDECSPTYLQSVALISPTEGEQLLTVAEPPVFTLSLLTDANITANLATSEGVGSVVLTLNDNQLVTRDNQAPYELFPAGTDHASWWRNGGDFRVHTEVYTGADGTGMLLDSLTVTFEVIDDLVTALETAVETPALKVFPNPVARRLRLSQATDWRLLSAQGTVLQQGRSTRIEMQHLVSGIYFLQTPEKVYRIMKE